MVNKIRAPHMVYFSIVHHPMFMCIIDYNCIDINCVAITWVPGISYISEEHPSFQLSSLHHNRASRECQDQIS